MRKYKIFKKRLVNNKKTPNKRFKRSFVLNIQCCLVKNCIRISLKVSSYELQDNPEPATRNLNINRTHNNNNNVN